VGGPLKVTQLTAKNPDEIRVVSISDAHMSPFNPKSWKANYWEHTRDGIQQVLNYAKKVQADAVIWPGDQYHLKTPARNPLYFVSETIDLLLSSGIPNYGIGGNHDFKMGSRDGLKGQPLEILIKSGVFKLLDDEELVITTGKTSVKIAGESYNHSKAEGCRDKKKDGADHLVVLGHFWFGQTTGEFFGEPMYGPDWLGKGEADIYDIGHHHLDQGIQHFDGKAYIVVGSISRTGSHSNDLERRPAASVLTFKGQNREINAIRPKVLPIGEALDLEVREKVKREEKEMKAFIENLKSTNLGAADPVQAIAELDLPKEVQDRALKYLEQAESE